MDKRSTDIKNTIKIFQIINKKNIFIGEIYRLKDCFFKNLKYPNFCTLEYYFTTQTCTSDPDISHLKYYWVLHIKLK